MRVLDGSKSSIISIHALLAESDMSLDVLAVSALPFLSTLSLRRATGEKQANQSKHCISIHALLAESDVVDTVEFASSMLFLSTLSLRRATVTTPAGAGSVRDFYPRSPCGERRASPKP